MGMYPAELYGGMPPHNSTDTSTAAAASVLPHASTLQARVLQILRDSEDGLTDERIQRQLGRPRLECPRRRELVLMGLVEDSGRRRKGASGRNLIVWQVVKEA